MKKANQNGGGGGEEGDIQIMADSADSESDSIVDPDIRLALGRVTLLARPWSALLSMAIEARIEV